MRPSLPAVSLAVAPAAVSMAVSLALVAATPGAASAEVVDHRTVLTFADPEITESSGLVARGAVLFTVNDSGDGPYLYAVDAGSGDTVGVTTYSSGDVSDVEAIAPGPAGTVWVGDIGDNDENRPGVDVYQVPVERPRGDREVDANGYALVYPDGPHDAETLLAHPASGRLYVVSKGILGGTVYAAPATLDEAAVNPMTEVGRVPGLLTDGAFFPDGRHVLLRSYGTAAVYTFPGLRPVGEMQLPDQEQGEAVAVDDRGRVFLSSEGVHAEVLRIRLPPRIRAALAADRRASAPAEQAPHAADRSSADRSSADRSSAGGGGWPWTAGGVLLLTLAGSLLFTVSRRRSPRRR